MDLTNCQGASDLLRTQSRPRPDNLELDEAALSRQLAVFRHGGQAKIKDATVVISGLGALGIETTKVGCQGVTLHPQQFVTNYVVTCVERGPFWRQSNHDTRHHNREHGRRQWQFLSECPGCGVQ